MVRPIGSKNKEGSLRPGPKPRNLENNIRPLTGKEICEIIKTCRDANVSYCKFSEFTLEFTDRVPVKTFADETISRSETSKKSDQTVFDEEDHLTTLMLEDPAAYEKSLMDGDLVEDGDSRS